MPDEPTRSRFVVTMTRHPALRIASQVRIISASPDVAHLLRGRAGPDDTLHLVVPESRFIEKPNVYAAYKGRLTVVAEEPAPGRLLAMLGDLQRYAADYLFTPETIGDGTVAIMAVSLSVPVRLAYGEDWPEGVLEELVNYFLHSPTLVVPIEPFCLIAAAIGQQNKATLWEYFGEVLGRSYFVDGEQRVSLSERWIRRGMFFGSADQKGDAYKDSPLWTELEALDQRTFISQAPCAFCEHYRYCAGFWTTAERSEVACRTWRRLMDRLLAAGRRAVAESQEKDGA